jgi:hypothetical protein
MKAERMGEILDRVVENGSVDVVSLAQEFGVSAAAHPWGRAAATCRARAAHPVQDLAAAPGEASHRPGLGPPGARR